jgi:hypothetical protein
MIITPIYSCRNCKKFYPGAKQEIANTPHEKLVPEARYTLGTQDHSFRIGGKTIQMSDLHQYNDMKWVLQILLSCKLRSLARKTFYN